MRSNRLEGVRLIVGIEKERQKRCRDLATAMPVPSYNLSEVTVAFCASSPEALSILLDAEFPDVDMVCEAKEGMPLMHYCVAKGILTEAIADKLQHQIRLVWEGYLPVEFGKSKCAEQLCTGYAFPSHVYGRL